MRRRLGPTEKELMYIEFYTDHGDATLAAKQAGYSEHSAQVIGSQLKKKLRAELDERLTEKMTGDCALARSVIVKLCKEAQSDDIRLKAAKDIMDRGGHPAAKEIIAKEEKKRPDQLIEQLRGQLGDDVANAIARQYTPEDVSETTH